MTREGSKPDRQRTGGVKPVANSSRPGGNYTAFDRALVSAAQNRKNVEFHLVDFEEPVIAKVCSVDKYAVEVDVATTGKEWLMKSAMTRVKVV